MKQSAWPANMYLSRKRPLSQPDVPVIYKEPQILESNEGFPIPFNFTSRYINSSANRLLQNANYMENRLDYPSRMACDVDYNSYHYRAFFFRAILDERIYIANLKALQLRNEFSMVFPYILRQLLSFDDGNQKRSQVVTNEYLKKKRRHANAFAENKNKISESSCDFSETDVTTKINRSLGIFKSHINQSMIDLIDEDRVEKIKRLRKTMNNRYVKNSVSI